MCSQDLLRCILTYSTLSPTLKMNNTYLNYFQSTLGSSSVFKMHACSRADASLTLPMCFPCIYEYVPPYNRCRTQQKIMLILHYTKSSLSRVSPTKLSPEPPYNILYDPIAEICLGELFFPFHGDHVLRRHDGWELLQNASF